MPTVEFNEWASENLSPDLIAEAQNIANAILRDILPDVMQPLPRAWASKPRTYGAYKRMVMRKLDS